MSRRGRRRRARQRVELDLHGVSHADVSGVVHRFVNDHWVRGWRLLIITGDSSRMRRLVAEVLSCYDVDWWESDWNSGLVVVDVA